MGARPIMELRKGDAAEDIEPMYEYYSTRDELLADPTLTEAYLG